ncbi:MAG: Fe-S-containing hydro-lyase [Bacillota bacterium]|nr:Fe-S-containing hydro-lyase [Bacillota bacterium]
MAKYYINLPLDKKTIEKLKVGDRVYLTGYMYTGRDAAHKRLVELINKKEELPLSLENETIYYVGPAPAKKGQIIGSAGPTTSYRMDPYTVSLLEKGLRGMIGKGRRSEEVIEGIKKNKGIYFAAVGGAAAYISKCIKKRELIAYEDLGTEAILRIYVENFPVIVAIDSQGNNIYK